MGVNTPANANLFLDLTATESSAAANFGLMIGYIAIWFLSTFLTGGFETMREWMLCTDEFSSERRRRFYWMIIPSMVTPMLLWVIIRLTTDFSVATLPAAAIGGLGATFVGFLFGPNTDSFSVRKAQ